MARSGGRRADGGHGGAQPPDRPTGALSRPRRWLTGRASRIVVSVGLLVFLVSRIDLRDMVAELAELRLDLVALLFATVLATRLLSAFRWYVLLRARHRAISLLAVVRLTFVSGFVGYFTPGSLGIEVARLYGMAKATADAALSATSIMVERAAGFLALLLLVLLGLGFHPPRLPPEVGAAAWLALALLIAGIAALMTRPARRLTLWLLSGRGLERVRAVAQSVYVALDDYGRRPGLLAATFAMTLLIQLLRCTTAAVGAAAFGIHLPFVLFLVLIPAVTIVALLPISIAGLGVREVGFVYLFGLVGMPAEVAFPLSLLIRLATMAMALPGAWLYVRRGLVP